MTDHQHHSDPFEPVAPRGDDIGRLFSRGAIVAGWQCRWCPNLLAATENGGVLCLNCDTVRMTAG